MDKVQQLESAKWAVISLSLFLSLHFSLVLLCSVNQEVSADDGDQVEVEETTSPSQPLFQHSHLRSTIIIIDIDNIEAVVVVF